MFGMSGPRVETYTVYEPPTPNADRIDRADELQFVKDGFSWLTALVPPLGFAAQGLWLPALAALAVLAAFSSLCAALDIAAEWSTLGMLAIGAFLGFEASSVKRWDLERRGWRMVGVVNGNSIEDCERRFFESWLPDQPIISAQAGKASAAPRDARGWPLPGKA